MSRYKNKQRISIDKNIPYYRKQLDAHNTNSIVFHRPDTNISLSYDFILQQQYVTFVWGINSRMHKYAYEMLGDPNLWWIVALVNKKPTDAHWTIGEVVYVPLEAAPFLTAVGM